MSAEILEVWYAGQMVEQLPRLRGRGKHRVDYRHIIDWLVRKPGAFDNCRYRDELFPTSRFRMAWDALRELTPRRANQRYLEILKLAAEEGEALVDGALRILLEEGETGEGKLNVDTLRQALAEAHQGLPVTNIAVAEVALASLDELTWLERSPHTAVTSTITMTELLVHPYRAANEELVNQYYSLLASYPNLDWVAPDLAIADLAAQLRAQHRLRTPEALQAATAIRRGATAFLTNDAGLARVSEVEVAVLEQLR